MAKENWRSELEKVIDQNLCELIRETKEYDNAISLSKDKGKAQIWVALAIINHKLNTIISQREYKNRIPKEELKDILNTLEKL